MKLDIRIDPTCEEERVIVLVRERSSLTDEIERLVNQGTKELMGYGEKEIIKLNSNDVECFTVEESKVFAILGNERFRVRERLYVIEEMLGEVFVKINQSCIANIKKIEKFETSIAGAIRVVFVGGHKDYISRRQLKAVKERIGFKL